MYDMQYQYRLESHINTIAGGGHRVIRSTKLARSARKSLNYMIIRKAYPFGTAFVDFLRETCYKERVKNRCLVGWRSAM